jgi:flagellar basal-body rod protein FlgB
VLFDTTQLALERAISGASQRHNALAANIANASTPGYRRVDVDFHGALAAALGSSDAKASIERTGFATQVDSTVGPTQADGNSIDIDNESAKLAANALEQQAAVSVAKTRNAILRSAMGVA